MRFSKVISAAGVAAVWAILDIASATGATTINAGYDLLETVAGTTFGGVAYQGVPLASFNFGGTIGTQAVGTTDTIVHRLSPTSGAPIATEMVALQLMTTAPVDFGLGMGFYFITLQSARGGPASVGQRTISFGPPAAVGSPQGTFDSFFDVFFDLRLGSLDGPIAVSGDTMLSTHGVPWNQVPTPNELQIPEVNALLNGSDRNADFWPVGSFDAGDPLSRHRVITASIPEPASVVLLAAGFLCLVAHQINARRRRPA